MTPTGRSIDEMVPSSIETVLQDPGVMAALLLSAIQPMLVMGRPGSAKELAAALSRDTQEVVEMIPQLANVELGRQPVLFLQVDYGVHRY